MSSPHRIPERGQFSMRGRLQSVAYAVRGLRLMLTTQPNARVHACATFAVCLLGVTLQIPRGEWCWLVIAIVAVWTAEALNTALEFLCDVASPEFHPLVEKAKDVAAGGVLISALGSLLVGALVFGPRLWALGLSVAGGFALL